MHIYPLFYFLLATMISTTAISRLEQSFFQRSIRVRAFPKNRHTFDASLTDNSVKTIDRSYAYNINNVSLVVFVIIPTNI